MAFKGGNITITSGTAQALSATRDVYCSLTLQAPSGNVGNVYVGNSAVTTSDYFLELGPGDSVPFTASEGDPINTQMIYADADNTNDTLGFAGVAR